MILKIQLIGWLLIGLLLPSTPIGLPMGEETIGNKPLNAENYKGWQNIMPVANAKSRVYHTWVNGDEMFYFQSTTDQLNQLLVDFSKLEIKTKEVLILPQRDQVKSFDQTQSFGFNCQMHLVGGIAKRIAGKPKGNIFWPLEPQLIIHVTPETDLAALKVPAGCKLVSLAEIKERYNEGLTSTDQTVRGWGIGYLATLDPYDPISLKTIAELAVGPNDWVASNALGRISEFGPKTKDYLPTIRKLSKDPDRKNAEKAMQIVEKIQAACAEKASGEFAERELLFRDQAQQAQAFIDRHRGL